jgi:REP element-mobilizing transposase RayT
MPHWRQDGATYFVTFRLADSLPQSRLDELAQLKTEWELKHPKPRPQEVLEQLARMVFERVEQWLDQGHGSCVLKEPDMATLIVNPMHHFDGERYELGCYVVMPNHVHAIVRPTQPQSQQLEMILKSWKSHSARRINLARGQSGELWQEESYDRIIRDEEHLWRTIQVHRPEPQEYRASPWNLPAMDPPPMGITWLEILRVERVSRPVLPTALRTVRRLMSF